MKIGIVVHENIDIRRLFDACILFREMTIWQ